MNKWDHHFLQMTQLVSQQSKDRSTKVGAVIVGPDREVRSTGYNGFPRGVEDDWDERHHRPYKYLWTEHAERNALYNALRAGIPVKGCTMYMNFGPCVCHDCARGIIQAGITELVVGPAEFPGRGGQWEESMRVATVMLTEAGVKVRYADV